MMEFVLGVVILVGIVAFLDKVVTRSGVKQETPYPILRAGEKPLGSAPRRKVW